MITIKVFQSTPDLINRENQALPILMDSSGWFQSTPDLINRENYSLKTMVYTLRSFQSTPDLINRENPKWLPRPVAR